MKRNMALVLALLFALVGTGQGPCAPAPVDNDSDGYDETLDCNDTDPGINPGAIEVCDGIDQNCNTEVDEGVLVTWYIDYDGDSYGSERYTLESCTQPTGYVSNPLDCDDFDTDVNPARAEFCDGIDNNCSDGIDEPTALDAELWFEDQDQDGYGENAPGIVACDPPTATSVVTGGDCDDSEASVHPEANDICNDNADQNCDGTDKECFLTGTLDLSEVGVKMVGEMPDDWAGRPVSTAGDVNGDEYDDLLIGAPYHDIGAAYLVYGGMGINGTMDLSQANAKFVSEDAFVFAGFSLSTAGDVNNDGYDDLLIGAPDSDGAAYLVYGGMGINGTMDLSQANAKFVGEDWSDSAGRSVSTAGDVNNDGYDDLLIGAPYNSDGGIVAGAAYLIYGPVTSGITMDLSQADAKFVGEESFDSAGWSVSSAGDVNGDGYDDLLIGAPYSWEGGSGNEGAVYFVYGGLGISGTIDLSQADAKFVGEDSGDYAGASVSSAGDVNNDGYDDLLIGAPSGGYGRAYLLYGPVVSGTVMSLSQADASFSGEGAGYSVSSAGDVNGDGYDDLLIGAQRDGEGGAAYLLYGPVVSGTVMSLSQADAQFTGENSSDHAGASVSTAGDVNGDGYGDLLIGAPLNDEGGADAGAAYLVYAPSAPTSE